MSGLRGVNEHLRIGLSKLWQEIGCKVGVRFGGV